MSTSKPTRSDYHYLHAITTRWHDNDIYGHVNNVTYYSYFDSAVNSGRSNAAIRTWRYVRSSAEESRSASGWISASSSGS